MRRKHVAQKALSGLLLAIMAATPALADGGDTAKTKFFSPNEAPPISSLRNATVVGEVHVQLPNSQPSITEAPTTTTDTQPQATKPKGVPASDVCNYGTPLGGYFNCVDDVAYHGQTAYVNWEDHMRGMVQVDNRGSSQSSDLKYQQSSSGSHQFGVTLTLGAGVEAKVKTPMINFAEAKVTGQVSLALSGQWSWTTSTTVEDSWTVPAGVRGYTYSYHPGAVSAGFIRYHIYDDNGYYIGDYDQQNVTSDEPAENAYSFKHITQS